MKPQECSDLELEIHRLSELEAEKFAKLEQRYTEEDVKSAFWRDYGARVALEEKGDEKEEEVF